MKQCLALETGELDAEDAQRRLGLCQWRYTEFRLVPLASTGLEIKIKGETS